MGLKFSNYPVKGIDVSQWQGNIEWDKTMLMNPDFAVIKVGAGKTVDTKFTTNWTNAKGKVFRVAYFYLDYYSNYFPSSSAYGMTDEAWGKAQADFCWSKIKADPAYVFLDIENATSATALPLSNYTTRAQAIAKAFLERMDILNGKTNGIYCSLGLLTWFGSWFRNRPLWVAWYNEVMVENWMWVTRTLESVKAEVKKKGWLGKLLMWQYTSDGDVDDDGFGDGVLYGMDSKPLDLNIWTESEEEFLAFKGETTIPEPPPPTIIVPILNVPSVNQNNSLWKNNLLGFSTRTIGSDGCALSDVDAVIAFLLGRTPNPGQLNTDLKNVGGYEGALIVWDAITKLFPNIVVDWDMFIRDTSLVTEAKIDAVLLSKRPVLVQVDAIPATSILDQHWVVLIGKDSNGYLMMDPIDGFIGPFKSRYTKALRTVVYSKTTTSEPPVVVPPVIIDDAEKLKRLWDFHPNLH